MAQQKGSKNGRRKFLKTAVAAGTAVSIAGCTGGKFGGSSGGDSNGSSGGNSSGSSGGDSSDSSGNTSGGTSSNSSGGSDNGGSGGSNFKIGLTRSTSGDYAFASEMGFRGLRLWKDRINQNGGVTTPDGKKKVELVYYDDRSDKQRVIRLYKKLLNEDNVDVVFGPFGSTLTAAAASVVSSNNTFLLSWSAAATDIFEQGYKNLVSVNPTAPQITRGEVLGMSEAGVKDLAVIYLNDEFPKSQAKGIKKYAKENDINITHFEGFPASQSDFSSTLQSLSSKDPDAFYPVAYTDTLVNIVNQMKSNGVIFPWTSMTYAADPAFFKALGEDAKYFFGHTIYHPDIGYEVTGGLTPSKFYSKFKSNFDTTPSYIGALGYAGGYMLGQFMKNTDSLDANGLKQAALDVSGDITTITGNYEIKKNGVQTGFIYSATQNQSTNGNLYDEIEVVAPKKVATAKPKYPIPEWGDR